MPGVKVVGIGTPYRLPRLNEDKLYLIECEMLRLQQDMDAYIGGHNMADDTMQAMIELRRAANKLWLDVHWRGRGRPGAA